ncbi:MAG: leucine efflux protein LeuE [Pseudomonadota bacterium]|jgi:leucine efflux protein
MVELGIQNFWEFLLGTVLIVLLPGPNSLYVLTASAQLGYRSGWAAAFGIFSGDTVLMIATASGAASFMTLFPRGFEAFKAAGAVYLAWIGFQLLREGQRRWPRGSEPYAHRAPAAPPQPADLTRSRDLRTPYLKALGLSLTNPKAILFFLAFFTQFVRAEASTPAIAYFTLGVVVQIVSLTYLALLIFTGLRLQTIFETHPRWSASGIVVVSLCFIGFALKMLIG